MIKFVCGCGKHLRARDDMAALRTFCPRCGKMVGVPSLKPAHPGAAGPMTPAERVRHARQRGAAPEPAAPAVELAPPPAAGPAGPGAAPVPPARGKRRRRRAARPLGGDWRESLLYPLRAWRLFLGLAVAMTVLSACVAVFLPRMLAEPPSEPRALVVFYLSAVQFVVLLLGVPCVFLEWVLSASVGGGVDLIPRSRNPLLSILLSGARWLACFLAGPCLFAATGWLYWLNCGDPGLLDCLILAELGAVAVAYWIYALLAVHDRGRFRDLNPLAVADLAHRMGWAALAVVLAAALLLLGHGLLLIAGVDWVHGSPLTGLLTLAAGWMSGLFWGAFFCQLLGGWCRRSRQAAATQEPALADG
jgi:hypothetical protein